jgi:hypothetical protein
VASLERSPERATTQLIDDVGERLVRERLVERL